MTPQPKQEITIDEFIKMQDFTVSDKAIPTTITWPEGHGILVGNAFNFLAFKKMVVNEGVQLSIVGDSELHFTIKETEQPAQLGEAAMRAALEMAKKEIRHLASVGKLSIQCGVLEAIDEVLQSEASDQEPVALTEAVAIVLEGFNIPSDVRKILETAYYTRPTEFKTLTDDEIEYMWEILGDVEAFARAIEQELKDKNGY